MRSKKGFTLMELLVAVFIASMVTLALVTIWKAASIQTSQGQRQAIIRNNLSILMRALHRDITESDLILAPTSSNASGAAIVMVRNGHLVNIGGWKVAPPEVPSYTKFVEDGIKDESDPVAFSYCLSGSAESGYKIKRSPDYYLQSEELQTPGEIVDLLTSGESSCDSASARTYMDYVVNNGFSVSTSDDVNYTVSIIITKVFANSETPPIHIEIEKTFTKAGGA